MSFSANFSTNSGQFPMNCPSIHQLLSLSFDNFLQLSQTSIMESFQKWFCKFFNEIWQKIQDLDRWIEFSIWLFLWAMYGLIFRLIHSYNLIDFIHQPLSLSFNNFPSFYLIFNSIFQLISSILLTLTVSALIFNCFQFNFLVNFLSDCFRRFYFRHFMTSFPNIPI